MTRSSKTSDLDGKSKPLDEQVCNGRRAKTKANEGSCTDERTKDGDLAMRLLKSRGVASEPRPTRSTSPTRRSE
jgi:hypothetical protein